MSVKLIHHSNVLKIFSDLRIHRVSTFYEAVIINLSEKDLAHPHPAFVHVGVP